MGVLTILFNTENFENDQPAAVRQRVSSVWASGSDKRTSVRFFLYITNMYAVNAVYDGSRFQTLEPVSVDGRYEVVITFLRKIDSKSDMELYNVETLAAMQEAEDIASGKIQTKSYKTVAEMEADLDAEEVG